MMTKFQQASLFAIAVCVFQITQARPLLSSTLSDAVFSENTFIGKVFYDANRNGIQDSDEEGIPGVRLATVNGQVVETDGYGRYHIAGIRNFHAKYSGNSSTIIKLDLSSLPQGTRLTTEKPQSH